MAELQKEVELNIARYAGAVLVNRALCDSRDMLKPSARMLMFSQIETSKNLYNKPYIKCARIVGDALGHWYTHGDSSCYQTYARLAKPFAMRYPLEDFHGNYGTIAGSKEAAYRYTEIRLSELGQKMFDGIKKDTVEDWEYNFEETEQYPRVSTTCGFYNIVNGCTGIGYGAASSIPQFNLKEVNEALIKLLWNPEIDFDEIYCVPDFATGGLLLNEEEVKESLKNGQGRACILRSVIDYDQKTRTLKVSEIPYSVTTGNICEQIEKLVNENPNCGIENINDMSAREPDLEIYLSKNANPDKVLRFLYKNTLLQYHYAINMTMLENGRFPRVFTWREALQSHLDHEEDVYVRGFSYDLHKIKDRLHIIEGLLKAISILDDVIALIRSAADSKSASRGLQQQFGFTEGQAKAILDIKLSRLAHLEVAKLEKEQDELNAEKVRIEAILSDDTLLKKEIEKGLREVADKFGDARRTQILNVEKDEDEVIEKKQLSLSFTNKGAVFVTETSSLYSQRRNGIGTKFKLDPEEFIVDNLVGENTDTILFFTKKGMYYHMNLGVFNIGEKQYLSNFNINGDITAAALVNKRDSDKNIVFITKNGLIKKSKMSEYNLKRSTGAQALKLDDNDEIVSILFIKDERIGILSRDGQFIMIESTPIRALGRIARGIIGIKLSSSDYVISARAINKDSNYLFSITSDGYGKLTSLSEFNITNTNTKGTKIQRADNMCDFIPLSSASDVLINSTTTQIRISYNDIPKLSRGAQGTKLIKLTTNKVVGISTL